MADKVFKGMDSQIAKAQIDIDIGSYYAGEKPMVIHTIAGSSVVVCPFDPVTRIGGMINILLPTDADPVAFNSAYFYGANTMELFVEKLRAAGADRHRLIAKIYGGAQIYGADSNTNESAAKTVDFIIKYLNVEDIRIAIKNLGGSCPRQIYFYSYTGEVLVKQIKNAITIQTVIRQQQKSIQPYRNYMDSVGETFLFTTSETGTVA